MKKKNNVYLKAAKDLVKDKQFEGCCVYLSRYDLMTKQYVYKFSKLFQPNNTNNDALYWMGPQTKENVLSRSLALLFMHEIVNSK